MEEKDYDYIVTPFPEVVARFFHISYPVMWIIFSFFLGTLHITSCLYSREVINPIALLVVIAMLPGFIAIAIVWFSKALEKFTPSLFSFIDWPKEKILNWYESELRSIFNFKWMSIFGIFLAGICVTSVFFSPFVNNLKVLPKVTYCIMILTIGFLAGGLLYSMLRIALMVDKMGEIKDIKISTYQHPLASVKAVGGLLSKISLIIIVIYLWGISSVFIEKGLQGKSMIGIVIFFGFIVVSFFVLPQIKIHHIMRDVKHLRLVKFSKYVEQAFVDVTAEPSSENIQRVKELFEIQKSLNEMSEWPFDSQRFFLVITGIAIPLVVVLLQFICSKVGK